MEVHRGANGIRPYNIYIYMPYERRFEDLQSLARSFARPARLQLVEATLGQVEELQHRHHKDGEICRGGWLWLPQLNKPRARTQYPFCEALLKVATSWQKVEVLTSKQNATKRKRWSVSF